MKKHRFSLLLCIVTLVLFTTATADAQHAGIQRKLRKIPGVVSVTPLPNATGYQGKYEIQFEQPVEPGKPESGKFRQRIFLFHKGFDLPMVITTEGYAATYAEHPSHTDEIASHFKCNYMVVEHRYFGASVPEKAGWGPLTAENAAADHHQVILAFKRLYKKGKWLSTGISKGGTTALIHRVLYPDDVDITVSYVAPLNFAVEDGRHESHIYTNATLQHRSAVAGFQNQVLLRRDSMMVLLENYVRKNGFTYKIPLDELLDFLVLEYAFAFYQWGWDPETVPASDAGDQEVFMHLVLVSPPDYFAIESYDAFLPFFVQAARQLGYYGYEMRPYYELLHIGTTQGYLQRIFLPDSLTFEFDRSLSDLIQTFLYHQDLKVIFLYGEWDPWSASSVVFDPREKQYMMKVVKPQGSHSVRIANLPATQRKQVLDTLTKWMEE